MTIKIKRGTSRLSHAGLAVVDGVEFWSRPSIPEIPNSRNDSIHEVEASDRIDLLAKKYYKNAELWWVIAHANDLRDLPGDISPGMRLRIPDPFYIRKHLLV